MPGAGTLPRRRWPVKVLLAIPFLGILWWLRRAGFFLPLFMQLEAPAQTEYFVDAANGSDANEGTADSLAWKTIGKVTRSRFHPGDRILFRCGRTWREQLIPPSNGSPLSPITFASYGSGPKPRLLGSTDLSAASAWRADTGNIWKSASPLPSITDPASGSDVGNVIFDNESSVGSKKAHKTDMTAQGDFWFNPADTLLYLYSAGNPGGCYVHIEAANSAHQAVIECRNMHDITFDGLDIRYAGFGGIFLYYDCQRITVQNCDLSFMGGCWFGTPPTRSGQCFQTWDGGTDIAVRYCTFSNSYDVAVSPQGTGTGWVMKRQRYSYNIFTDNRGAFEFWIENGNSSADSIFFENNTCLNAGGGWGMRERSGHIAHFMTFENDPAASVTHLYVRNNIFDSTRLFLLRMDNGWTAAQKNGLSLSNNLYFQEEGTAIFWQNATYTLDQFRTYQSATGKDAGSVTGDPLFFSATDFHLRQGSPGIRGGAWTDLTRDFEGTPVSQDSGVQIGAFQAVRPAPPAGQGIR